MTLYIRSKRSRTCGSGLSSISAGKLIRPPERH
jgi:hypothetical protein